MKSYLEQSNKFSESVKLAFSELPINSVNHVRTFKNHKAFILMNNVKWRTTLLQRNMEREILGYEHFDFDEHCFKWTDKKIFTYGIPKHVAVAAKHVDLDSMLALHYKTKDYSDRFIFTRKKEDTSSCESLYNYYDQIQEAVQIYYLNSKELIKEATETAFELNTAEPLTTENSKLIQASSVNMYLSEKLGKPIRISSMTYTFLIFTICGWTSKEIAEKYKMSYRTVEGYLQTLRDNLDCKSTHEVFYFLQTSNAFSIYFQPLIKNIVQKCETLNS